MTVTITGTAAVLTSAASPALGVAGRTGTVELLPMHPSGARPSYAFTGSILSGVEPWLITLTSGGSVPSGTEVLATGALRPAGAFYRVTWRVPLLSGGVDGETETITYDAWVGPDGGTCDITDPQYRLRGAGPELVWPADLPPVPVYQAEGSP